MKMTAEKVFFTLAKDPLIKEKIIILEETDGRKAVIFPQYRAKEDIEHAELAKAGEVLELTGKWGTDKRTNAPQFFVDTAFNAKLQKELNSRPPVDVSKGKKYGPDEVDPTNDFTVGGLSTGGKPIVASEPREGRKQYFTDGDWYWYPGNTHKTPTSF